jgi:hypothetical protein
MLLDVSPDMTPQSSHHQTLSANTEALHFSSKQIQGNTPVSFP